MTGSKHGSVGETAQGSERADLRQSTQAEVRRKRGAAENGQSDDLAKSRAAFSKERDERLELDLVSYAVASLRSNTDDGVSLRNDGNANVVVSLAVSRA